MYFIHKSMLIENSIIKFKLKREVHNLKSINYKNYKKTNLQKCSVPK